MVVKDEEKMDLLYEQIAILRRAMLACIPAIRANGNLNGIEILLWEVGQGVPLSSQQKGALSVLEKLAGYSE